MPPVRALIFDLDGTLVDSLADIARAVNAVLVARHLEPVPLAEYRRRVGHGLRALLADLSQGAGWSTQALEAAYAETQAVYRQAPAELTTVYPGLEAALEELAPSVALGILSNKDEDLVQAIVARRLPRVPFAQVWGALPGRGLKPDPGALVALAETLKVPVAECRFVGDSEVDAETARRAGMGFWGVAWGYRDVERLRAAGAEAVLADAEALRAQLRPSATLDKGGSLRQTAPRESLP